MIMSLATQQNTIYLTPDEDERIRKTFKSRIQKCQELASQPRMPSDLTSRQNQVVKASLFSDIAATSESQSKSQRLQADYIVALGIGRPYPPCTVLLQDLRPMVMSDLRMDTHHRGFVLTVKRVAPVVKLVACSWTIVEEDASGETERLEIQLHKSKHGEDILELGNIFKIKEPYFTISDQGEPTIRIDHPSDISVEAEDLFDKSSTTSTEKADGSRGTVSTQEFAPIEEKTAVEWKDEGNAALRKQALALALNNYTRGLQLIIPSSTGKNEIACDLFRNRAHVNLLLGRLDAAKSDAISSLTAQEDQTHNYLASKAYFRAGCAAYKLGEFKEAKDFFEEQLRFSGHKNPANPSAHIRKAAMRIQEQSTGVYNFEKIRAGLSMAVSNPQVDASSFTRNVEIGESPGRGRGLFATRNIDCGEIIMGEKAFCVIRGHQKESMTTMTYDDRDERIRVFPAGLCKIVVQKLLNNPSQVEKVMDLFGDYRGLGNRLIMSDFGPIIDTFQVHDIVSRNAFGPGSVYSGSQQREENVNNGSAGLWILASYANHSCIPNSEKEVFGDLMVLRASRSISAGEEILHSYHASSDYDARSAALMNTWGFTCNCKLCIAEKADEPDVKIKRLKLESEANILVVREPPGTAKRLSIVRARRLASAINGTYNEERYEGLPRTALLGIQSWLTEATAC